MTSALPEITMVSASIGYTVAPTDNDDTWTGLVLDVENERCLDVGVEATELEAVNWCKVCINLEPWIDGNPGVEDMVDRAKQ